MGDRSRDEWPRLGKGELPTEDQDFGLGHIVSVRTYNYVYFTLLVLTVITVWAAYQDFGPLSLAVALAIATIKAGVVTLMFMHLNYESKIVWGIVIYPLFIFFLILMGTLGDASVTQEIVPLSKGPAEYSASIAAKAKSKAGPEDGHSEDGHSNDHH